MWDQKYRPLLFAEVLGQKGAVEVLTARLCKGTALDTSYIFSGGHGQGKTTLARILARALLCTGLGEGGEPCNACDNCTAILTETSMAFMELDAASKGTIDNIRGIVDDLPFAVPGAAKRIYLFDEAHRMSRDAQDVLLKPIEDKEMIAILCTTEPEKIRGTIRSRCEQHSIRKITREEILERMEMILRKEGVEYEDDAILTVIDYCGGHVRDILNKLEMVAQLGAVTTEAVRERLNLSVVSTYYQILLSLGEPSKAVVLVEQACDRVGVSEVSTGLAEAAMNAFRLAHGMFAEFVLVDRELAKCVYDLYGDDVVNLAGFFLKSPPSKIGLVCDVVRCHGGVQTAPAPAAYVAPVKVTTAVKAVSPASVKVPEPPQEAEQPEPPTQEPQPGAEAQEAEPEDSKLRPDGVGPLGSSDVAALTEEDAKAVPEAMPRKRGRRRKSNVANTSSSGEPPSELIPTPQWRREFTATWTQRGSSGG